MSRAVIFPGQGSQAPGMCSKLYHTYPYIRSLWDEFGGYVGFDVSRCILEGDAAMLQRTSITQPALFLAAISAWTVLKKETTVLDGEYVCAGHSVGEYAALVATNALSIEDAGKLLALRGRLMEECVVGGGLIALVGGNAERVEALIECVNREVDHPCYLALENSSMQHVVGGVAETLEVVKNMACDFDIKRAIILAVSGPFHTPYMREAQEGFVPALDDVEIRQPDGVVVSSVFGGTLDSADAVREALARQTVAPVRWGKAMGTLNGMNVAQAFELGPGSVLKNLMRKEYEHISVLSYEEVM